MLPLLSTLIALITSWASSSPTLQRLLPSHLPSLTSHPHYLLCFPPSHRSLPLLFPRSHPPRSLMLPSLSSLATSCVSSPLIPPYTFLSSILNPMSLLSPSLQTLFSLLFLLLFTSLLYVSLLLLTLLHPASALISLYSPPPLYFISPKWSGSVSEKKVNEEGRDI